MSVTVGSAVILRDGKVCLEAIRTASTELLKHYFIIHERAPYPEALESIAELRAAVRAELVARGVLA